MEDGLLLTTYTGLFLAAAYDRTGTPAPAVVGGIAAATGHLNIVLVIVVATVAGVVGELVFYLAGYSSGVGARYIKRHYRIPSVHSRIPQILRDAVSPAVVGHPAVLVFGRFLPVVGRLVVPLAGIVKVPPRTVVLFTMIGQLLLVSSYAVLAYGATRLLGPSSPVSAKGGVVLGSLWVLPFAGVVVFWGVRAIQRRRSGDRATP